MKSILPPMPAYGAPATPGEMLLEEFLRPLDMTIEAFAAHVGMTRAAVSEIVNGRRGVTPSTAMRFARALHTSESFWLVLQVMTDLHKAHRSSKRAEIECIAPLAA